MADNPAGLRKCPSMLGDDGCKIHPGILAWANTKLDTPQWFYRIGVALGQLGFTHIPDWMDLCEEGFLRCMLCINKGKGTILAGPTHFTSKSHLDKIEGWNKASGDERVEWYGYVNREPLIGYSELPDSVILDKIKEKVATPRNATNTLFPDNMSV